MHYWVLIETEHRIMRHHMMTVRNYMIMSFVLSDLPNPKDYCCTPLCNHHKMEVVHSVWDMNILGRHSKILEPTVQNFMAPSMLLL